MSDRARHLAAADVFDEEPDGPSLIAEWAVLGTAIQSQAGASLALAMLEPRHFTRSAHQFVLEAVQRLSDTGRDVDPTTVLSELASAGMLAKTGSRELGTGGAFLHSLMARAGDIGYHAPKVLAEYWRRGIRAALASAMQMTGAEGFDTDVHPEQVRKLIEDATAFTGSKPLRSNAETVAEVLNAIEAGADPGLPTGYGDLDDAIGGMRPGELIVVGARPGAGKSLIGLCIADYVASHLNLPVLFTSLEMTEAELTMRRIAATAKVPLAHLVRGDVSDWDWDQVNRAHERLTATRLYVDDTPKVPLAHIRSQLLSMTRTGTPARLLVIDYLGFLVAPKAESRQQAVAEVTRNTKNLAREFGIPVILLAQLNRGPESRNDKRPSAADLRESGEVEQTADIILMLHRQDMYEPESPRAGEIDVLVVKNRQGPLCTVTLNFQGHYGRITSMTTREWTASTVLGGKS